MVPSTCVPVDNASADLYEQDSAKVKFKPGKTGTFSLRCAVTNPRDSDNPGWDMFAIGCSDPDGVSGLNYESHVELKRVKRTNDQATRLETLDCNRGTKAFSHAFDFDDFAYYVTVNLTRKITTVSPTVWFVQLKKRPE
jgi:hypothetical protein